MFVAVAGCREKTEPVATPVVIAPLPAPPTPSMYNRVGPGFGDSIARLGPSLVTVRATTMVKNGPAAMYPATAVSGGADGRASRSLGTGFVIAIENAPGTWIVTSEQIARAAAELRVVVDGGNELAARVVGSDSRLGVALLTTMAVPASKLVAVSIGNSDEVRVGDWLAVIGDPFAEGPFASVGIVSSLGAAPGALSQDATTTQMPVPAALNNALGFRSFFVTDALVHRGNSGGPVIDTAGNVIAMALLPPNIDENRRELSFVVPINRIIEIANQLRERGSVTRAWLGALVQPLSKDQAAAANLPDSNGAVITEIKPGSPASKSVLRVGDIILQWAGRAVDARTLPYIVSASAPGKAVAVSIWRSNSATVVQVTPEQMPE
jgi:serine protease Do